MKKSSLITFAVILAVILLAVIVLTRSHPETSEEIAQCIGENSVLYTQLGCHACKYQEDLFGENYKYLNVVDCFFEQDKCIQEEIRATPTWIIKGEKYVGARSVEQLKELAGC
ncbi:MAG TPA: hypothetical protein VJ438_00440 [Candidatus Nanoarchaeia archaeon]|nr:hypothetical protein [Candidatus Nanoarchaeia archaeon]